MILTIEYTLKFDSFFISKSLLNVEEPQSNDYGFRGFYTKSGVLFSNKQFLPNYMMLQERRLFVCFFFWQLGKTFVMVV